MKDLPMTNRDSEKKIEKYLYDKAKEHNFECMKFVSPGRRGVPDRILIGNGYTVFVEMKAPDGILSEQQKFVIDKMRRRGAIVTVLWSKSEIDKFFEQYAGNNSPADDQGDLDV